MFPPCKWNRSGAPQNDTWIVQSNPAGWSYPAIIFAPDFYKQREWRHGEGWRQGFDGILENTCKK